MTVQRVSETDLYKKYKPSRKELLNNIMWIRLKFLRQNLSRASNRGSKSQQIDVSLDYLHSVGEKQKWKCALTGLPLEFTRGGTYWGRKWCNPMSCTIDRIDSSKGYVIENIQLVIWKINSIKKDVDNQELIEICKLIAKNHRK